jgi:hypothetical protein
VAREVLALTHLVFFAEASTHPLAALLRGTLVPLVAPAVPVVLRRRLPMAAVVRLLSQQWVRYPHSPISLDAARGHRGPRPGDRLPDSDVVCGAERTRTHDLLATPGVHVLLERDAPPPPVSVARPWVSVHRVDSWIGGGLLAVRPDGHVGLRSPGVEDGALARWLDLVGVRSSRAA